MRVCAGRNNGIAYDTTQEVVKREEVKVDVFSSFRSHFAQSFVLSLDNSSDGSHQKSQK